MYIFIQKNKAKVFSLIIFFLVFVILPMKANAATLSVSPSSGTFAVGDTVSVKVLVSSGGDSFNAVSGVVSVPVSMFTIDSVSKKNSALNFWVTEPAISKGAGTVKFEGIALGGSTISTGTIISINLRVIKSGEGQISFKSGQILANDGQGTDITGSLNSGNFSTTEAAVKAPVKKLEVAPETAPTRVAESKVAPQTTREPEVIQPLPTLKAPNIIFGEKYGVQAVVGTSDYPQAKVLITFIAEDGVKIFILSNSDADGNFYSLVPNSLKHGYYNVSAVLIKDDKTNSEPSNIIVVQVGNIFSDLSLGVFILIGLLILVIIYLFVRVYFHLERNRSKLNRNTLHKTEDLIHKSFGFLREDVEKYDNKKISSSEQKHLASIEKDIEDVEKIIAKEVKDIE